MASEPDGRPEEVAASAGAGGGAGVRLSSLLALVGRGVGRVARKARPRPRLRRHELSVVACDLRGFTRFSSSVEPDEVVDLLADYYGAIGETVAAFRGSIKEHAGDGTLALVGAPRPVPDHAERALAMALAIGMRSEELLDRWRAAGVDIGLGIGVASGEVTVGDIRAGARLEPVAVGAAVNLASRLCARALAGQVLVAERTVELVREELRRRLERLEPAELKGFARPIPIFQALPP
jgi:adenylate cyclase